MIMSLVVRLADEPEEALEEAEDEAPDNGGDIFTWDTLGLVNKL